MSAKIYGVGGAHHSSCVYIEDGEVKYAIEEERLIRKKACGEQLFVVPEFSVKKIEQLTGVPTNEADFVIHAEPYDVDFGPTLHKNIERKSHHWCHAIGAYYTSGFKEKTLVVSTDGGGKTCYGRYFIAENGEMEEVHASSMTHGSAGQFYIWLTESLGWKMLKDEGKVTGLAGHGEYDERLHKIFKNILTCKELDFESVLAGDLMRFVCSKLSLEGWLEDKHKRAVLAYNAQLVFEEAILDLFNNLHERYPEYRKVCVAGGPFANVKLNQQINELEWVDEIYVVPPMGDNGLALGAAISKAVEIGEWENHRFKNVFLGVGYTNEEVLDVAYKHNFRYKKLDVREVAQLLNDGKIIGWFKGRFEYGPRALGARSILVRPTDRDTHKELNKRLGRHEIMPFAPMVLAEYANELFDITKSQYTAEFMTMCYNTRSEWVSRIPAVVHEIDSTARPQIVVEQNNPLFHEVANEYYKVSGIPCLLNTSFNGHNEPIIDSPENASTKLAAGMIDYLAIEDYLCWKE